MCLYSKVLQGFLMVLKDKQVLACENHYTLLYVTMHLIPAAVTEESVGPAGSG